MAALGMLVYGEQEYEEQFSSLLKQIQKRASSAVPSCLETLRALVIQTGQLEQAVEDLEADSLVERQTRGLIRNDGE